MHYFVVLKQNLNGQKKKTKKKKHQLYTALLGQFAKKKTKKKKHQLYTALLGQFALFLSIYCFGHIEQCSPIKMAPK